MRPPNRNDAGIVQIGWRPPSSSGNDAIEAGTPRESHRRTVGHHPVALTPEDENRAGQSGKRAREREGESDRPSHRDAGVAGGVLAEPHGAQPVAERGAPEEVVRGDRPENGEHGTNVEPIAEDDRKVGGLHEAFGLRDSCTSLDLGGIDDRARSR